LPCRRESISQRLDPLVQAAIGWPVPLLFMRHDEFECFAITLDETSFLDFLDGR
jgi:hypothetical protein